jgi:hypothetical protein
MRRPRVDVLGGGDGSAPHVAGFLLGTFALKLTAQDYTFQEF